ncbi:hypothetical protein JTB14_024156 [Gonioctena quinquepunctata]|nr:hypothetical protein JTB14_024156 [Gonioctena quinquepunctata]
MIRIVIVILVVIEPNVVVSGCIKTGQSAVCDSVTELSQIYFNQSLEDIESVEKLSIRNNHSELLIHKFTFKYLINLKSILVRGNHIQVLYQNTFEDLPLKYLYIDNNGIEKLLPGTFRNLSALQKLEAQINNLKTIPRGVFKDLPSLEILKLSKNEIKSIEDFALENLPRLKKLQLDHNKIDMIFIHKIVSHPEQLQILWLHNNSLTLVSNFMLQKLTKLKLLNLGFNKISAIEINAFEQTPELETLVLTHNKLKEVDVRIFPRIGLNYLTKLYLDNNELLFLPSGFFFRLNSLEKITLVGNPWECSCHDVINRILMENGIKEECQNLYVTGKRPICVSGDATICLQVYNEELSKVYMDYKKAYPIHVSLSSCIL